MMAGTSTTREPLALLDFLTSPQTGEPQRSVGFTALELLQKPRLHSPPLLADTLTALPEGHDVGSGGVPRLTHLLHILWIGVWTDGCGD